MQIDKPRCDLTSCRNYFDGNCTRDYEMRNYPKCKAVNDKIEYEGYALCKVDEAVEKDKEFIEIITSGKKEKPYYEIKYLDLQDNQTHIGYSSYSLDAISDYLKECFM